ncbi:MAG TPA: VIT domain-containing protein, partial [Gemmataceae bacterium]|nr:VIT domain-containing protein [Gemmataceae bacterium]
MRRFLPVLTVLLAAVESTSANGLLIPEDKQLPPLAMLNHQVKITLEDQVAITHVEQTFRNHTDRQLEATYVFPVPKGASVTKFTMWMNGKETHGELLPADKAREVYTSIVRRTQDPGLLEYIGNNVLRMRVFPVPAKGDQKVAFSYESVASREAALVEYIYPLKTDGKATATLEKFGITATIKSQHGVQNVYSPTHSLNVKRVNDREVAVEFERNQGLLDKDFQMFYSTGDKDVGLTALLHRPVASENGYFMLLLTPKIEMSAKYEVSRDMVMILDTSGSMRGVKMDQAKKALKYCLDNLGPKDRFALMNFATTVNKYKDGLLENAPDQLEQARKWVDRLEATGGTAINDALAAGLELRTKDETRTFTIIFFTDGMPTVGETNIDKILKNTLAKNSANTRIFTFGVGDDVNASFLDKLADETRAVATYVRPAEDIEAKVSGLYAKISHPVLTNLKVVATNGIDFNEVYPPQLPDLFHGGQVQVLGRFSGKGPSAIKLTGQVGMETKEFAYDLSFPDKTADDKEFVEHIWARRKVGYVLDQIRSHGESKELKDEVIALAKKYGITTPYTSWLIAPDAPLPVAGGAAGWGTKPGSGLGAMNGRGAGGVPAGLARPATPEQAEPVLDFAARSQTKPGELAQKRERLADEELRKAGDPKGDKDGVDRVLGEAKAKKDAFDQANVFFLRREHYKTQAEKLGVDLSVQTANLRNQCRLENTVQKNVQGR